jgi:hypothetical protein
MHEAERHTLEVDDEVFRAVYDSPSSLPGRHRWVTSDEDVRELEKLLGIPDQSVGAPLWLSGDEKNCPECGREFSWLDIVASGVAKRHSRAMLAKVILGEQKYVNTEAPRAIANVHCFQCGAAFDGLRSFKCHNWAYAIGDLLPVLEQIERSDRGNASTLTAGDT